jgi:hypothetical protein
VTADSGSNNHARSGDPTTTLGPVSFLDVTADSCARQMLRSLLQLFAPNWRRARALACPARRVPCALAHPLEAILRCALQSSTIAGVNITLTSHDSFPETDDNWNIQSASISLSNSATGQNKCFSNALGNPFARLTGSSPTVLITAGMGCP